MSSNPSFGARLREHRERQQISLDAIAAATKIKLSILEGLERDDVSQWPDGIYRRAYVRAYARAVSLDPDTLVRDFLAAHPDPVVVQPGPEAELEEPAWPSGIRRLVTSAISAIPQRRLRDERDRAADSPRREPNAPAAQPEREPPPHEPHPPLVAARRPTLEDAAALCTRLARAGEPRSLASILEDAARSCDAVGIIVWSWEADAAVLRPAIAHGYTDETVARLPLVRADDANAIASAFRSDRPCIVNGGDGMTGAVVIPLLSPHGCVGVLAMELREGGEQHASVRDFASIVAAQLAARIGSAAVARAVNS